MEFITFFGKITSSLIAYYACYVCIIAQHNHCIYFLILCFKATCVASCLGEALCLGKALCLIDALSMVQILAYFYKSSWQKCEFSHIFVRVHSEWRKLPSWATIKL